MTAASRQTGLVIFDGHAQYHRACHASAAVAKASAARGGRYGLPPWRVFARSMELLARAVGPSPLWLFVEDGVDGSAWRRALLPGYKAGRPPPPWAGVPGELERMRGVAMGMRLRTVAVAGEEADDVIASYAAAATVRGLHTTVVTADKDMLQVGASAA